MGLVRSVHVDDGRVRVELLLTTGWCPFAATVLTQVRDRIIDQLVSYPWPWGVDPVTTWTLQVGRMRTVADSHPPAE